MSSEFFPQVQKYTQVNPSFAFRAFCHILTTCVLLSIARLVEIEGYSLLNNSNDGNACKDSFFSKTRVNSVDNNITPHCAHNLSTSSETSGTHSVTGRDAAAFLAVEDNVSVTQNMDNTFIFEKYVSEGFVGKNIVNYNEVSHVLKQIRLRNVNRVIIGHLNVNFFAVKLDAIKTIIPGNVDIMIFGETKLDSSYPTAQLTIEGFKKPFRLDRNANGGGLLIYVRADIPCKQVNNHEFSDSIEGMFIEINFRSSKWLLFGTYHPPSQNDNFYFNNIGRALDIYTQKYDKILLAGDFNAEEEEVTLNNFMELYDLKNLVKEKTCFKSVVNPSCVDLFLTNCSRSFQHTNVISTGISDHHKMIITVLKTTFKKSKPKEIFYRCYKNFDRDVFRNHLRAQLENCENYTQYKKRFLEVLDAHAPLKKKVIRANEVPYMTKSLRKAIATRSRLENRYYKNKSSESLRAYKTHKNFCSRLYKKERKKYYTNLDVKKVTDNKNFWKTMKPFFHTKGQVKMILH